jgi:hypothetical protein
MFSMTQNLATWIRQPDVAWSEIPAAVGRDTSGLYVRSALSGRSGDVPGPRTVDAPTGLLPYANIFPPNVTELTAVAGCADAPARLVASGTAAVSLEVA